MKHVFAVLVLSIVLPTAPAAAADDYPSLEGVPMRALAPADMYFGRARMSVLGIANVIRDAGARLDEGAPAPSMVDGPLSFVGDAIRDWERKYPDDPWIARDLYALELVYVRVRTPQGFGLARKTHAWLVSDYPDSAAAREARRMLGDDDRTPADAWERFAAMRAPIAPQH